MKNLEKTIILALHPECETWEDAVEKEKINQTEDCGCGDTYLIDGFELECQECGFRTKFSTYPISLPRIIQALREINHKSMGSIYVDEFGKIGYHTIGRNKKICDWKLTDKNAKDLNLEDQTEETREALNKLFR